ncbi:hypothetical protein KEH51_02505 [[Brevibacterium] frigoritolerans]|uniref:Uncharacterized protein n=1 Tax=Peribacillus frigoritolerans TaxID=450367 RepID=A0A941J5Z9_9BACI|nr:hypothetical protein [Peribacillus frigoritolerans]
MVKVSSEHSDVLILTMDDLNSDRMDGMESTLNKLLSDYSAENGKVIPDRTFAIQEALQAGKEGDWIIITGKGIESMIKNSDCKPFLTKKRYYIFKMRNKGILSVYLINS